MSKEDSVQKGRRRVDIASFLLARIAEDEANLFTMNNARVLAECAAKRAIVELHAPLKDEGWKSGEAHGWLWCGSCGSIDDSPEPFPCDTLKALVAIYKDHPDYRQE